MRYYTLELVMQMGRVIRLGTSLIIVGAADVFAIGLLTASLHPRVAQRGLGRVQHLALATALVAALPFVAAAAFDLASVILKLTRGAWVVSKVEADLQPELGSAFLLLVCAALAATPAALTAALAVHRSRQLDRAAPLVPERVRIAIVAVTAPWAAAAWLLAFECVKAMHRGSRDLPLALAAELLFLLIAVTACFVPRQMARKSRLPNGPPAGFALEPSRFQALTNASGRTTLRPASHP